MQIEIKNVSFTYNAKDKHSYKALDNVSFSIEKGDFICIVGETGAGKSTLIQMINGLNMPDEGEIKVDEFIVSKDKKVRSKNISELRKKVGIVFQFPEYQLFEDTVLKDVMFGPINFGVDKDEALKISKESLINVGIDETYFERSPFELSGGEKRRVAIAGILSSNPDILIFDEPTVGLDPKGKKTILKLIRKFNEEGKTIILVTHDMEVVNRYAKKVALFSKGKLIKYCTREELFLDDSINELGLEKPLIIQVKDVFKKYGVTINGDSKDEIVESIKELFKHE